MLLHNLIYLPKQKQFAAYTQQKMTLSIAFYFACFFLLFALSTDVIATTEQPIVVILHIEPPYSNIVDGKFVGENVDIARALAAKAGKKVQFAYCPVARCMSMIERGQADMIVGIRKTALRQKNLGFLTSPIKIQTLPLRFYIHSNSNISVDSYNDLYKMRVGVLRGSTYFDQFDFDKKINKVPLTNYYQLVDMLLKGRIDTFLEREETIMPIVNQSVSGKNIKLAKFAYDKGVESYIAISKKSPYIKNLPQLSAALEALLASGEIKNIIKKTKRSAIN